MTENEHAGRGWLFGVIIGVIGTITASVIYERMKPRIDPANPDSVFRSTAEFEGEYTASGEVDSPADQSYWVNEQEPLGPTTITVQKKHTKRVRGTQVLNEKPCRVASLSETRVQIVCQHLPDTIEAEVASAGSLRVPLQRRGPNIISGSAVLRNQSLHLSIRCENNDTYWNYSIVAMRDASSTSRALSNKQRAAPRPEVAITTFQQERPVTVTPATERRAPKNDIPKSEAIQANAPPPPVTDIAAFGQLWADALSGLNFNDSTLTVAQLAFCTEGVSVAESHLRVYGSALIPMLVGGKSVIATVDRNLVLEVDSRLINFAVRCQWDPLPLLHFLAVESLGGNKDNPVIALIRNDDGTPAYRSPSSAMPEQDGAARFCKALWKDGFPTIRGADRLSLLKRLDAFGYLGITSRVPLVYQKDDGKEVRVQWTPELRVQLLGFLAAHPDRKLIVKDEVVQHMFDVATHWPFIIGAFEPGQPRSYAAQVYRTIHGFNGSLPYPDISKHSPFAREEFEQRLRVLTQSVSNLK